MPDGGDDGSRPETAGGWLLCLLFVQTRWLIANIIYNLCKCTARVKKKLEATATNSSTWRDGWRKWSGRTHGCISPCCQAISKETSPPPTWKITELQMKLHFRFPDSSWRVQFSLEFKPRLKLNKAPAGWRAGEGGVPVQELKRQVHNSNLAECGTRGRCTAAAAAQQRESKRSRIGCVLLRKKISSSSSTHSTEPNIDAAALSSSHLNAGVKWMTRGSSEGGEGGSQIQRRHCLRSPSPLKRIFARLPLQLVTFTKRRENERWWRHRTLKGWNEINKKHVYDIFSGCLWSLRVMEGGAAFAVYIVLVHETLVNNCRPDTSIHRVMRV